MLWQWFGYPLERMRKWLLCLQIGAWPMLCPCSEGVSLWEAMCSTQMSRAPEVIPHSRREPCLWVGVCATSATSDLESACYQVTIWDHLQWPTLDSWTHWWKFSFSLRQKKICNESAITRLHPYSEWTIGTRGKSTAKTIRFLQMQVKLYFGLRGMFVQHFLFLKVMGLFGMTLQWRTGGPHCHNTRFFGGPTWDTQRNTSSNFFQLLRGRQQTSLFFIIYF